MTLTIDIKSPILTAKQEQELNNAVAECPGRDIYINLSSTNCLWPFSEQDLADYITSIVTTNRSNITATWGAKPKNKTYRTAILGTRFGESELEAAVQECLSDGVITSHAHNISDTSADWLTRWVEKHRSILSYYGSF